MKEKKMAWIKYFKLFFQYSVIKKFYKDLPNFEGLKIRTILFELDLVPAQKI